MASPVETIRAPGERYTPPHLRPEWIAAREASRAEPRAWHVPHNTRLAHTFLLMSDAVAFALAMVGNWLLYAPMVGGQTFGWGTIGAGVAWLILRGLTRLYAPEGMASPEEFRRNVSTTLAVAGTYLLIAVAQHLAQPSRPVVVGTWLFLLPASLFLRGAIKRLLSHAGAFGRPVVVLGAGRTGRVVIHEMQANPLIGLKPVAVFDDDPAKIGTSVLGVPVVGSLAAAATAQFDMPVTDAIVALPRLPRNNFVVLARQLAARFTNLRVVPDLFGMVNLWVQPGALGSCLTLELRHERFDRTRQGIKRGFDLLVGVPAFLVALPVMTLAAIAVKLKSPAGPALFAQPREGLGGHRIRVWKIRTMVPDAAEVLEEHLNGDLKARAEWERKMKLERDPRVIGKLGRLLRRTSIDELPQLWNVITGDLSLVGPRPFPDYHLRRFDEAFRTLRREVCPGITGYWQVTDRSNSDLDTQEAADSYYIYNWSLWLDVWILARTVGVVVSGKGAY